MKIAVTGGTGFLGSYLLERLLAEGHEVRAWHRPGKSKLPTRDRKGLEWVEGDLGDPTAAGRLLAGCDSLVHAALWRPGSGFRGAEGNVVKFAEKNVVGSLQLFQEAAGARLRRVVYVSSCAVHEQILPDRPLDETHPLYAKSHYGAHKAAVEAFVHSFAAAGLSICAVRPTGIYGVADPAAKSKWFDLVRSVAAGDDVDAAGGGKEVHVADVAAAISLLLNADGVDGECYACYDRYISDHEVATLAKELSGSKATVKGERTSPKHEIDASKIRDLGMKFSGDQALRKTVADLVAAARAG